MQGGVSLTWMVVAAVGHDGKDWKAREEEGAKNLLNCRLVSPLSRFPPWLRKALGWAKESGQVVNEHRGKEGSREYQTPP